MAESRIHKSVWRINFAESKVLSKKKLSQTLLMCV